MNDVCSAFIESVLQQLPLSSLELLQHLVPWQNLASQYLKQRVEVLTVILSDEDDKWDCFLEGYESNLDINNIIPRFTRIRQVNLFGMPPSIQFDKKQTNMEIKKVNQLIEPFISTVEEVNFVVYPSTKQIMVGKLEFLSKLEPKVVGAGEGMESVCQELVDHYEGEGNRRLEEKRTIHLAFFEQNNHLYFSTNVSHVLRV
uniref:F-box domain-containing protein n=1 Tax=Steinernema glaseri TaxID=37863 RepID=A0A1I8AF75_9BILA